MVTPATAVAILDHHHEVSEVRKWIAGVDEESVLNARADLSAAAGRARGYALLAKHEAAMRRGQQCR